jgi:hypothetical protein
VGTRQFDENGQLELDLPMRDGLFHGTLYSFDNSVVISAAFCMANFRGAGNLPCAALRAVLRIDAFDKQA